MTSGFEYVFWFQGMIRSARNDGGPYWNYFPTDYMRWEFDLTLTSPKYGPYIFSMYRLNFTPLCGPGIKMHGELRYSIDDDGEHRRFHDLSRGFWFYVYDGPKSLRFRELNSRVSRAMLDLELSVRGISAAKSGSGLRFKP